MMKQTLSGLSESSMSLSENVMAAKLGKLLRRFDHKRRQPLAVLLR
jgi:hypothetical protein